MSELPETEAFREFANRLGCKPGYVTQLRQAGRLVLSEDGRRVCVAESLQLIASTRDPAKQGVRAHHAATRGQGASSPEPAQAPTADANGVDPGPLPDLADPLSLRRAKAQAEREEALARKALREEQVEMGELLSRVDVVAVVDDAVVQLRRRLELMPAVLAPELAAMADEDAVRVKLRDNIEQALGDLARKFGEWARADA